ncbi:MAG: hypothetical protein CFE24_14780 [Flavobacterium sp. BFFFF2]|nr:MAG: hypothetical protein CFE24_14780 [Flavobacterium sp. BFFFF2]
MSKQPISILTNDKEFVERLILYSNQYNKIQEELRKDYQNEIIPVLKEEFSLNRKWVNEKLSNVLNQHKEFYFHRIAKQIELPADFSELMAPIFEVRKFKALCIASQAYEEASKYRDKELSMLMDKKIIYFVEEFNDAVSNELKGCINPQDYYVSGSIFLTILEPYLGSNFISLQNELKRICSKWLLNEVSYQIKISTSFEQELALAMIGMKKLKWENEIIIK